MSTPLRIASSTSMPGRSVVVMLSLLGRVLVERVWSSVDSWLSAGASLPVSLALGGLVTEPSAVPTER